MNILDTFLQLLSPHKLELLLHDLTTNHGMWIYIVLFAIIFIETGFVIMPFLPGDSLLFLVGMLIGGGKLNLALTLVLLSVAAILGDTLNYYLGRTLGKNILSFKLFGRQLVKAEHLQKAEDFYVKYGAISIVLARFVPIVRTFAPFVAGIARMSYRRFATYNIIGGIVWICIFVLLGVWLGEIDWVKKHLEKMVIGIVFLSILPMIVAYLKARFATKK
jgi:membrane-associated protein